MNYEEYMRSVLGYTQVPNNIYTNTYDNYYYDTQYMNNMQNVNTDFLDTMYPEIYRMIYPMICKVCSKYEQREITRDLLENMSDEVYSNIEADDRQSTTNNVRNQVLKNGDVRNPNAKETETRQETRQSNYLLRDLIKILILRELTRPNRPGPRPYPPRPGFNGNQPWRPY